MTSSQFKIVPIDLAIPDPLGTTNIVNSGNINTFSLDIENRITIPIYTALPAVQTRGSLIYLTSDDNVYKSDGTAWVVVGSGGPLPAILQSIADLSPVAADNMIYTTGVDTFDITTITGTARTLLDDATIADMRTTLDVVQQAASSTDNAIARWSGTGGDVIQDSGVTISDAPANNMTGIGDLTATGTIILTGVTYPTVAPTTGQFLVATSASTTAWQDGPIGLKTIWVPAPTMIPSITSGAVLTQIEGTGTPPVNYKVLDFDSTADESVQFDVSFPKSWNEGTVTYQVFWEVDANVSTGVAFALQGAFVSDGESADATYGTAVVVTDDAQGTGGELLVTDVSAAVTISGTITEDGVVNFRFFRDVSDPNDDMTQDARVRGIKVFFTVDAANDS